MLERLYKGLTSQLGNTYFLLEQMNFELFAEYHSYAQFLEMGVWGVAQNFLLCHFLQITRQ